MRSPSLSSTSSSTTRIVFGSDMKRGPQSSAEGSGRGGVLASYQPGGAVTRTASATEKKEQRTGTFPAGRGRTFHRSKETCEIGSGPGKPRRLVFAACPLPEVRRRTV